MKNRETKIIYLSDSDDIDNIKNIEREVKRKNLKNILFAKINYPDIIKSFIEANSDKKITFIFDTHGTEDGNLRYEKNIYSISQLITMFNLNNNHEAHFFCCHAGSKHNLEQLTALSNIMQDNCPVIFLHSGGMKILEQFSSNRILGMMENKVLNLLKLESDNEIDFLFPETINILHENNIYRISPFEMYKYKDVEYDFFTKNKINYIGALEHMIFQQEFVLSCTLDSVEKTLIEQNIAELERQFITDKNLHPKLEESISNYLIIGIYLMAYRYCDTNIKNPDKDYKLDKIINAISKIEYKNNFLLEIMDDHYFQKIATQKPQHYSKILDIFKEDYQIISILNSKAGETFINNNFTEFCKILSQIDRSFILKNILESQAGKTLFDNDQGAFFRLLTNIKDEGARTSFLNGIATQNLIATNSDKIFNLANGLKFEKNLMSFLQGANGSNIAIIDSASSIKLLSKIRDKKNIINICNCRFGENLVQNNKDSFLHFLENLDKENYQDFLSSKVCAILIESVFKAQKFDINFDISRNRLYIRNFKQSNISALNIDKKFSSTEEESPLGRFLFENKKYDSKDKANGENIGTLIINFKDSQKFTNYIISKSKTIIASNLVRNPQLELIKARFAGVAV